MFTVLYNNILPVIGDFFGKLVAFSSMPFSEFIEALQFGGYIYYTNLLTGVGNTFKFVTGIVTSPVLSVILRILTFGVDTSLPVWAVMLTSFIGVYAIIALLKFIL